MQREQDKEHIPSFLVCVRVRPLTTKEIGSGVRSIVRVKDNNVLVLSYIAHY
jgi:ribosomal protein S12